MKFLVAGKYRLLIISSVFALVICLVTLMHYYQYYYQSVIVEGIVDHKAVVGIKNEVTKMILMVTPHGIIVKDRDLERHLTGIEEFKLSKVINILDMYYDEIYCTVSIRTTTGNPLNGLAPGETLAYIIDEKYFDMLKIGAKVKFKIMRLDPLGISEIIKIKD